MSPAVKAVKQAFAVRWFLKFRFRGGRRDWAIEAVNFGLIGLAGGMPPSAGGISWTLKLRQGKAVVG